ncbi:hypothetical protein OEZ85_014486 [Tetradesmus obliquus]|uniref:Uncharacterized protein n=1 Tax=Tetradesmus obliquus TaxID=3088 RepID=A0ABY8UBD9_TETOB|nr:hypothetical protein OEZ85_014486 [Tetradesmus obliquus]
MAKAEESFANNWHAADDHVLELQQRVHQLDMHLRGLTEQMLQQGQLEATAAQAVDQWAYKQEAQLMAGRVNQNQKYVAWKQDALRCLTDHYNEQENDIERVPFAKAPTKAPTKSFDPPVGARPTFVKGDAQRAMERLPVRTQQEAEVLDVVLRAAIRADAGQKDALKQFVNDHPVQTAALKERWLGADAPAIQGWGKDSLSEQAANRDAHVRAQLELLRVMPDAPSAANTYGVLAVLQTILDSVP